MCRDRVFLSTVSLHHWDYYHIRHQAKFIAYAVLYFFVFNFSEKIILDISYEADNSLEMSRHFKSKKIKNCHLLQFFQRK